MIFPDLWWSIEFFLYLILSGKSQIVPLRMSDT